MSDYDDWTYDDYDPLYDYDNDGKHDFYEYTRKEDDDDYFYQEIYGGSSGSGSSHSSSGGKSGGLSLGQSILYGLIAYVLFFTIIGVNPGDGGEYLPLILWGVISTVLYFGTNSK